MFITAPHTPETEGMFGSRQLALLPDGALLVNVARGKLVDTAALLAELSAGRITAALKPNSGWGTSPAGWNSTSTGPTGTRCPARPARSPSTSCPT